MECSTCMILGSQCKAVDLSYPLNDTTIFWPGGEKFNLCMYSTIEPTYGYHYAAGTFSCAEHGGTHVDAPFHFAKDGKTVDMISLNDLIAPCRTIDITAHCSNNADYVLTAPDIMSHEHECGRIEEGSIILVRTGWSRFWKSGPKQYLGFDEAVEGPFTAESRLQFPGIGLDAAQLMIERKISAVGLDTGNSKGFAVHCMLLGAGIYGIENVNGAIDQLPPSGYTLVVMPMKITGGSGAPARVVATIPL